MKQHRHFMAVVILGMCLCMALTGTALAQVTTKAPALQVTVPVTLEFRDTEVVQIYQALGALAGWNVIADPSVKGRFTVSLKAEPLNRALELIAGTTGFGYALVGNTLVVASPERLSFFAKREVAVFHIASMAPETAKTLLEIAAPGALVTVDSTQRLALISGTADQLQAAQAALEKFDIPVAKEYEFVDQPVGDILRALARSAGLNVLVEGNLNAKLTIYLKDIQARDAIDLVAQRAGVQKELLPSGVMVFRPASTIAPTVTGPNLDSQVLRLKYLPISTAVDMLATLYPSLDVKVGKDDSFLAAKGPASDVAAAFAFLSHQDFPTIRLAGIVQHESGVRAVLELAGRSYVVQTGQAIDDLIIEAIKADSVTVRRGERVEVVNAGGLVR